MTEEFRSPDEVTTSTSPQTGEAVSVTIDSDRPSAQDKPVVTSLAGTRTGSSSLPSGGLADLSVTPSGALDDLPNVTQREPQAPEKRIYKHKRSFDHDLYKLRLGILRRNVSYQDGQDMWVRYEHVHFFHTIDSKGRPQKNSTAIGGHFHYMEKIGTGPDGLAIYKASKPMVEVWRKVQGKRRRVAVPVIGDDHDHEVDYQYSEKITPRKMNKDFIRAYDAEQVAKTAIANDSAVKTGDIVQQ